MTTALILVPLAVAWLTVMGWILVQLQEHTGTHCAPRPVNGRYLGTLPRITTPDRPPWHTMPHPVLLLEAEPETPRRAAETAADPVPLARPYAPQVCYGQVPVQRMLAQEAARAERLAGAYLP